MRGFFQNRMRFFRLTKEQFAFYARDQGELISHVARRDIAAVREVGARCVQGQRRRAISAPTRKRCKPPVRASCWSR